MNSAILSNLALRRPAKVAPQGRRSNGARARRGLRDAAPYTVIARPGSRTRKRPGSGPARSSRRPHPPHVRATARAVALAPLFARAAALGVRAHSPDCAAPPLVSVWASRRRADFSARRLSTVPPAIGKIRGSVLSGKRHPCRLYLLGRGGPPSYLLVGGSVPSPPVGTAGAFRQPAERKRRASMENEKRGDLVSGRRCPRLSLSGTRGGPAPRFSFSAPRPNLVAAGGSVSLVYPARQRPARAQGKSGPPPPSAYGPSCFFPTHPTCRVA